MSSDRPTPEGWETPWRPPAEKRWTGGRTEPGTILVRSEWDYSPSEQQETGVWPFSRGGDVVRSDWPQQYDQFNDIRGHVYAAICSFGDDADIVIEVRLARPEEVADRG